MSTDLVKWIEGASYEQMLRRNRFGFIGDPIFQGDMGTLFMEQMKQKKDKLSIKEQVQTSKRIGWEN